MNVRRLAFWAALLCGLTVYVLLFENNDQQRPDAVLPAETYARVCAVEPGDITGVLLSDGKKTVRLARTEQQMRVVEPHNAHISADLIDSLLSAIAGAVVIDEIEPGEDPAQYGLSPPALTLQVRSRAQAEPLTLLLGASAPSMINMYASLPQQNKTVLLGTYLRFALQTFLDNVRFE